MSELRHPSYPTLPNSNMTTQKLQRYSYEILDKLWEMSDLRHPSYPTPPDSNMPTQKLQRYSYEILDKFWDFSDRSFSSRTL